MRALCRSEWAIFHLILIKLGSPILPRFARVEGLLNPGKRGFIRFCHPRLAEGQFILSLSKGGDDKLICVPLGALRQAYLHSYEQFEFEPDLFLEAEQL